MNLNAIPPPPDNIYRFSPAGINASIGLRTIGGQDSSAPQYGAGPFPLGGGISFLYDANDGVANDQRLSIDLSSGNDLRDTVRMPGFRYDQASNTITPGPAGRCDDFDREGCANISIGTTAMTISNNFILGQVDPFKPPFRAGSFGDIQLNGQWSVPVIGGDPVDVPAPPVLMLFGLGAGALVWRKRKLNK
nr:hypothetical protein [uncultured bacterium]